MLEFIETYGAQILNGLLTTGVAGGLLSTLVKVLKIGKKVDANAKTTTEAIQITREGIVEAFKMAKIPTEWRISVSNQITAQLTKFINNFTATQDEKLATLNASLALCLKILSCTAAAGKLTEEDKIALDNLNRSITAESTVIDISDPSSK